MSCSEIQQELVGYHFGIVEQDDARRRLEDHLVGCPDCIKAFVAIKRDIETAASGPRPSAAARQRLRLDVAEELGQRPRRWSWWERPLAFGFAAVALFLAMFAVSVLASGAGSVPHGMADRAQRTEARTAPPRGP